VYLYDLQLQPPLPPYALMACKTTLPSTFNSSLTDGQMQTQADIQAMLLFYTEHINVRLHSAGSAYENNPAPSRFPRPLSSTY